jgi:hypothetical protein
MLIVRRFLGEVTPGFEIGGDGKRCEEEADGV